MSRDYSPFTPGVPVKPEDFVGKIEEVERLLASCRASVGGRFERTFVQGERGIGKSSLCGLIRSIADDRLGMLAVQTQMGGADSVEEFCRRLYEDIARASRRRGWFERVKKFLGDRVSEVGVAGVRLAFQPSSQELKALASHLPESLETLQEAIAPERKGLLLIVDDINGLAESQTFADWLKSFVDRVALSTPNPSLHLVLAGLPERRESLVRLNPSLNRVFNLVELGPLSPSETKRFFREKFASVSVEVDPSALDTMSEVSGGYPVFMHEIGDAVYRVSPEAVPLFRAFQGIEVAAESIGRKYLDQDVVQAIHSERYRRMLARLAHVAAWNREFSRRETIERLPEDERKTFDNFVRKMRELGVLESPEPGVYRFKHFLHLIYYRMAASLAQPRKKGR